MFICPVRSRPHLLKELLISWNLHSAYPLAVLIGHDDPALDGYLDTISLYNREATNDVEVFPIIYPRTSRGTCSALNYFFRMQPNLGYYGFIGEDCVLQTPNLPLVPLANYFAIAWPNDGFAEANLCTHPVIGGELVRAVGYLALPTLYHSFFDNVWHTIGLNLQVLHYCPAVEYDHNHPIVKHRKKDSVNLIADSYVVADEDSFRTWAYADHTPKKPSAYPQENLGQLMARL
jgi:hypothetical protein